MRITGLNHFNIVTTDLEGSAQFYERLGLRRGHRPDFGNTGIWLYIGGEPRVHLNLWSEIYSPENDRGAEVVNHLGFDVAGTIEDVCARLDFIGIKWRLWPEKVPGWYRALYFEGPSGEQIEFVLVDNYVPVPFVAEAQAVA